MYGHIIFMEGTYATLCVALVDICLARYNDTKHVRLSDGTLEHLILGREMQSQLSTNLHKAVFNVLSGPFTVTCRPVSQYPCPHVSEIYPDILAVKTLTARPPWPAHMAIGPSGESEMRNFRNNKINVHDVSILFKKMKSMVIYIKQSMSLIKRLNLMK